MSIRQLLVPWAFLLLLPCPALATDNPQQQAEVTVSNALSRITMAQGAVGQVLDEAVYGQYGELHKWSLIDQKMDDLGSAISESLPVISSNVANLPSNNPAQLISSLKLGYIFEGNIERASTKKKQLLDLLKPESQKLAKLDELIAKTGAARRKAAMGLVGDTIEGLLPDEKQLGGEAAVIVLGAYFGPPGIAAAALVVGATFTFNSLINLYYGTKALADQAKVLTDMELVLNKNRQTVEQNVKKLTDAAREMTEVERVLKKNQTRMDGFRKQIEGAIGNWAQPAPQIAKDLAKATASFNAAPKNTGNVSYTAMTRTDEDLLLQAHSQIDSALRQELMSRAELAAKSD